MFFRRFFTFIILIFIAGIQAKAGSILYAELGVNGLTCSQCTRSVEMKLKKLGFVENVSMDLEHTNGIISFREGKEIDFNSIARAVTNAGFSVRYLKIKIAAADWKKNGEACYTFGRNLFQLVGALPAGDTLQLHLLGSNFMPPDAAKKVKPKLIAHCAAQAYFVTAK